MQLDHVLIHQQGNYLHEYKKFLFSFKADSFATVSSIPLPKKKTSFFLVNSMPKFFLFAQHILKFLQFFEGNSKMLFFSSKIFLSVSSSVSAK